MTAAFNQELTGHHPEPKAMPASIENPNFDLDDPDAYDLLTDGAETPAGVRVSASSAVMHPAVHQALTLISGDVAGLPLDVYTEQPNGDRDKIRGTVADLVKWQPNPEMSAFKFWRRMLVSKLLYGNAYAYIERDRAGNVVSLSPLLPDRTTVERIREQLFVTSEVGGRVSVHPMENIFHLEGISLDHVEGMEFLRAARNAIGLALAEMGFASQFYANGGRVGGILELPRVEKPIRDKIEEGFRRTYGNREAFRTIVLREGATFHQAQVSPVDAQVVEARQESVRDIARLFNIRPGKLGEESRSSFASKSEDNRDYYETTLRPHLREIEQECRAKLLTSDEQQAGIIFEHDTRQLLAMDFASTVDAISQLIAAQVVNPNEARRLINMNRRTDPAGDEYRNPNINTTESEASV